MDKKVWVGLSGGVDSAVSTALLKLDLQDISCIYMNCFSSQEECENDINIKDALKVANYLGVSFDTWDLRQEYEQLVLADFYNNYKAGLTPNPDILCNSMVKFGAFAKKVLQISPNSKIATGHYARIDTLAAFFADQNVCMPETPLVEELLSHSAQEFFICSSSDKSKDQSYFLYRLYSNPQLLSSIIFPIGGYTKSEVRGMAKLHVPFLAEKPDSQGICFVGSVKMRDFLKEHVKALPGNVIDTKGGVIGSHSGVQYYTIGQRHGFHLSTYKGQPLYVLSKDIKENTLTVAPRGSLYVESFELCDLVLHKGVRDSIQKYSNEDYSQGLQVRIRNLGKKIPCKVKFTKNGCAVTLAEKEFGVAPGQSAVFYLEDLMLGGGVIRQTL